MSASAKHTIDRLVATAQHLRQSDRRPDETAAQSEERKLIEQETADKVLGRSPYAKKLIEALKGPKRDMNFTERMQLGAIMVLMDRHLGSDDIGYAVRRAQNFWHPAWQRVESVQRMCAFRDKWHVKQNDNEDLQMLFYGARIAPPQRSDDDLGRHELGSG